MLEARYLVAERVYFHHAKVIAGAMLARAIQEAHDANAIDEERMWQHSDDTLVFELMGLTDKSPLAAALASAYWQRQLHKCAFEYRAEDIEKTQANDHKEDWKEHIYNKLGKAAQRRSFENYLADVLMVSPGDVLVYFPDKRMNLKQAQMRVLWKGQNKPFSEIDDPITGPRLKAVIDAHQRLWSIRVLVSPKLNDEQRILLRELCDLELFTQSDNALKQREDIYERIVWRHIEAESPQTPITPVESRAKVKAVVKQLCALAKDSRENFAQKVKAAIQDQFKQDQQETKTA